MAKNRKKSKTLQEHREPKREDSTSAYMALAHAIMQVPEAPVLDSEPANIITCPDCERDYNGDLHAYCPDCDFDAENNPTETASSVVTVELIKCPECEVRHTRPEELTPCLETIEAVLAHVMTHKEEFESSFWLRLRVRRDKMQKHAEVMIPRLTGKSN